MLFYKNKTVYGETFSCEKAQLYAYVIQIEI